MSEKKTLFTVDLSVKDMPLFTEVLTYVETLIEILSNYDLSDENRRKLNAISDNIPDIMKEDE